MGLNDQVWRLNNFYRIIDRNGDSIPFRLNPVQKQVLGGLHTRNLILKARQLGMSTFSVIYLLDEALFNKNLSAGIVSYSLEHAQHIFKRIIGHALDTLPELLKEYAGILQRSAREISFNNGSFLRVDTTLRGGAYQLVLVSEFGKTCARNPLKAEEVITGTLQTVPINGRVIIESTGEGNSGFYADLVNQAVLRGNKDLSNLEYKLFFFPWFEEKMYQMEHKVDFDVSLSDYFDKIEKDAKVKISLPQRNWYAHQRSILGEKVRQEFPSTVSEAFISSSDAYYFQSCIEEAYRSNRCLTTSLYDPIEVVYVAMDIGVNDLTVITFFQVIHGEIRIIDFYDDKNKGVDFYARFLLQEKPYIYNTIFLPHDAAHRDGIVVENTYERDFKRLFSHTTTRFIVLKRTDKNINIANAKTKFSRCVFNITKVKGLIDQLAKYRKKWSEQFGKYEDTPYHGVECFIGETLVETELGEKRIDQIVIGDKVLTPTGLKPVKNVFKYKTKDLVQIKTSETDITCTPHHMIFASIGLTKACSLAYNSYILTKGDMNICQKIGLSGKEKGLGFKDYFVSMNPKQLFSLMAESIGLMNLDITEEEKEIPYNGQYGSFTMERFRKSITYITLMAILKTTTLKIYNVWKEGTILGCIGMKREKRSGENFLLKTSQRLLHGNIAKKALNTEEKISKKCSQKECYVKKIATSAVKNIRQFTHGLFCVPQIAQRNTGDFQEKIMNQEFASSVPLHIYATGMTQEKHALENALIILGQQIVQDSTESKLVKNAEKNLTEEDTQKSGHVLQVVGLNLDTAVDVYDLEIEEDHCYFANSILVSNSNYADSFIYCCQAVSHIESTGSLKGAFEKHKEVVANRISRI